MAQSWTDLLFAHWPVPNEALRVPEPLELDTFEETAWLGITPFNVRTYVRFDERPGIWFFSLDAGSAAAVAAARASYHLPYHHARAAIARTDDGIRYRSTRTSGDAELDVSYSPTGAAHHPAAGTLEHWLTERYCLYAFDPRGRLLRAEVH